MITLLLILSLLFNTLLGFAVYNLLKKNEQNEEVITEQQENVENSKSYVDGLSIIINEINIKLKDIDSKGSFKSDDEIGWFFKDILYIGDILNQFSNAKDKKTKDN